MRLVLKSAISAVVLLGAAAGPTFAAEKPVAIGTLPQGSLGFSIAAALAKVGTEKAGLEVRAIGQGGSSVYLPKVNSGELEFGTSNTFEVVFATKGTGNFEGHAHPNLRVAAMLSPFTVGLMVAKDSDIKQVTDLKGRPFPTGYAKQRLVGVMQEAIFNAVGMSDSDLKPVPVPNFVKGAELLAEGKVAGVLLAPGSGVVKKTHAQRPVRFITIPNDPKVESAIHKALPGSRLVEVKPNPRLVSIAEPVNLIGYQYALVTNAKMSDDVVYRLVKSIHDNKAALAASHGVFRQFDPAAMAPKLDGATYHPGAIKFYKEAGIWKD
jgi:TRAP transporter TAXI family solute receptor